MTHHQRLIEFLGSVINNARLLPQVGQGFHVSEGGSLIHLIFISEQFHQVLMRELFLLHVLPKIGRTLIHADDIAEINILLSLSHNDILTANGTELESWFCLHTI